jgi:hypothetical protein
VVPPWWIHKVGVAGSAYVKIHKCCMKNLTFTKNYCKMCCFPGAQ